MNQPYARREDETPKAWAAFCAYRDAGPLRTIRSTAIGLGKHYSALDKWSVKYSWVARTQAWDRDQDIASKQAELEAIKDMRRRHMETAMLMQQIADDELIKRVKLAEAEGISLDSETIIKFVKEATTLERLSRNEPQEIIKTQVEESFDYSLLDIEELRFLRKIKKKMRDAKNAEIEEDD